MMENKERLLKVINTANISQEEKEELITELNRVYVKSELNQDSLNQIRDTYKVRYEEFNDLKKQNEVYKHKAKGLDKLGEKWVMIDRDEDCHVNALQEMYDILKEAEDSTPHSKS